MRINRRVFFWQPNGWAEGFLPTTSEAATADL